MYYILIDTCVWLDLAKDHKQRPLLAVLEELIRLKQISLILPRIVVIEFARNKAHIAEEIGRSLSGVLKRAREAVNTFGEPHRKSAAIELLEDLDHRLPLLGEGAFETIGRIEALFRASAIVELTDSVKVRVAQRGIDRLAPFHRQRNSTDDAILIEVFADAIGANRARGLRYAFVTHNVKDFSHPAANQKLPHPDIAAYFSKIRSRYFISLGEAMKCVNPVVAADVMIEEDWELETRRLSEIAAAINVLWHQIWYNRHQYSKWQIEAGKVRIVEKEELKPWPIKDHEHRPIQSDVWEMARKAAKKVEKEYGKKNLGPWDDFEWGMINGKLSALRWVLGDEWDFLDT